MCRSIYFNVCYLFFFPLRLSDNFLYLPERVVWCDLEYHHAIGLGPLHIFDEEKDIWIKKSIFTGIYGKTLTLFYLWKGHIYYGGLYKVINMRAWNPDGSSFRSKFVVSLTKSLMHVKGTYILYFFSSHLGHWQTRRFKAVPICLRHLSLVG